MLRQELTRNAQFQCWLMFVTPPLCRSRAVSELLQIMGWQGVNEGRSSDKTIPFCYLKLAPWASCPRQISDLISQQDIAFLDLHSFECFVKRAGVNRIVTDVP